MINEIYQLNFKLYLNCFECISFSAKTKTTELAKCRPTCCSHSEPTHFDSIDVRKARRAVC